MPPLVWSPIGEYLLSKLAGNQSPKILIAPFIQKHALYELLACCANASHLQVITRWRPADLAAGVSDPAIFPLLKAKGASLFVHNCIHLKMLIFDESTAFVSSANITHSGLGLPDETINEEVGCEVRLTQGDWLRVFGILEQSILVDEALYHKVLKFKADLGTFRESLPKLDLGSPTAKPFSKLSLPASEDPETLYRFYLRLRESPRSSEETAAGMHDLLLYRMPEDLTREQFMQFLSNQFTTHPFIVAFTAHLKANKSLRFGAVNDWLTTHCSDKPTPYRWEMKSTTRRLYNWLAHFFPEVSWDRPNHSQVIYWQPPSA